jgi:hypothetical protein
MIKWFVTFTFVNIGLLLTCFGLMAEQNRCETYLVNTFYGAGRFSLYFGGGAFFIATVSQVGVWAVRRYQRRQHG